MSDENMSDENMSDEKAPVKTSGKIYSNSEIKEMLLDLANDFNNLLVGIIGNARFLLEEKHVKPSAVGLVDEIIRCAERCTRLTAKLHHLEESGEISQYVMQESDAALQLPPRLLKRIQESFSSLEGEVDTILVIDDEEVVRNVSTAILERAGFRVVATGSGKEGIKIFEDQRSRIHSVLLDLTMPYIRGNLVFARLKAIDPEVRVLLMSGYSDRQVMQEFEGETIAGFLKKPFDSEDLLKVLRKMPTTVHHACTMQSAAKKIASARD
ncbi:MAG: response regulator [Deltaproteobacteria bacterium]|nr:response regulator [Deltaproteobacteria bacterium]